MTHHQFEKLIENLQTIMRCPHCSGSYTMPDIHYLGQMESLTFLHMRCQNCQTPVFASVAMATPEGDLLPTDLTADDVSVSNHRLDLGAEHTIDETDFDYRTLDHEERTIPVEDLTAEKVFAALNPVSYDDVLDAHYLLDQATDLDALLK